MELSYLGILHTILIFQGFSIALFLFLTKRGKAIVNIILGLILIVLSIHMLLNLMEEVIGSISIIRLNNTLGFLYGPLIWIFINKIVNKAIELTWLQCLVLLPFIISTTILFALEYSFFGPFILILTLCLLISSMIEIKKHENVIKQTSSNSHTISLKWLYQFIWTILILFLIDAARNILAIAGPINYNEEAYFFLLATIILMINMLVFKSLNHTTKFSGISENDRELGSHKFKSYSMYLNTEDIRAFAYKAEDQLLKNETYRKAELSLQEFAQELMENPRIVSHAINFYYNTNFSDWINSHRINYAMEQLRKYSNKEKNISQIIYESGFNSTSSFYAAFSKKTSISPKEYRKKFNPEG